MTAVAFAAMLLRLAAVCVLLSLAAAQEAFGADVANPWPSLNDIVKDLNRNQKVGVFVVISGGLLVGFALGRLRRYGWDVQKAWRGKEKKPRPKRMKAGIESVVESDEEEEVDESNVRGTPAYQRKIRGKAITILVVFISAYYLNNFIKEHFKEETAEIKAWAREYVRAMTPDWVPDLATPLSSFQKSVQEWADDMGVHNQHKQGMSPDAGKVEAPSPPVATEDDDFFADDGDREL